MSLCDRLVNEQFEEEQQEPQQFEEEPEPEYFGEEGKWSSPPAYLFWTYAHVISLRLTLCIHCINMMGPN